MTPRSSMIERGLVLTNVLAAVVLAVMAVVVNGINKDAELAGDRSIRAIKIASTLDKLQLALRDGDTIGRDLVRGSARDRADTDRFDAARFQARLNLAALGPLTGDDPAQAERLSRLTPMLNRKFTLGLRNYDAAAPVTRDEADNLIAEMRDDETRQLEIFGATQRNANQRSTWIMVGSLALVSALALVFWILLKVEFAGRRALEGQLIESATMDELTGVANRSDLERKLMQEWTFRKRYGTALSLLIVDVDDLKGHNEQWGHIAGDVILREVARRLAAHLRRSELIARSGGDEFAIIVPQYRKEAMEIAEQLREEIANAAFYLPVGGDRPTPIGVTVSIGVAEASDVETPRQLLAAADAAMYEAKQRGRSVVSAYQPDATSSGLRASTGLSGGRTANG